MTIERQLRLLPSDAQIIATERGSGIASPPALIVAGPTASGKSALAMELAEICRGTIINADAMQVYRELRVLTARPSIEEEAPRPPCALRCTVPAAEPGSVAWWRGAALAEMDRARDAGRLPILTGGTGLYFAALTQGLAAIPDPGSAAREEARRLLRDIGPSGPARPPRRGGPRNRRPPASHRQPAYRPRLGDLARHRAKPRVMAGVGWRAGALALRRHSARSAARRIARGDRGPARGVCCAEGAIEEVRALLALGPGSGAAGDAGAWRAGTELPICAATSRSPRLRGGSNW